MFLVAVPGFVMLGLGINGVFPSSPDARLPFLENPIISHTLLILGGVLAAYSMYIPLKKTFKRKIKKK